MEVIPTLSIDTFFVFSHTFNYALPGGFLAGFSGRKLTVRGARHHRANSEIVESIQSSEKKSRVPQTYLKLHEIFSELHEVTWNLHRIISELYTGAAEQPRAILIPMKQIRSAQKLLIALWKYLWASCVTRDKFHCCHSYALSHGAPLGHRGENLDLLATIGAGSHIKIDEWEGSNSNWKRKWQLKNIVLDMS